MDEEFLFFSGLTLVGVLCLTFLINKGCVTSHEETLKRIEAKREACVEGIKSNLNPITLNKVCAE